MSRRCWRECIRDLQGEMAADTVWKYRKYFFNRNKRVTCGHPLVVVVELQTFLGKIQMFLEIENGNRSTDDASYRRADGCEEEEIGQCVRTKVG